MAKPTFWCWTDKPRDRFEAGEAKPDEMIGYATAREAAIDFAEDLWRQRDEALEGADIVVFARDEARVVTRYAIAVRMVPKVEVTEEREVSRG